MTDSRSTQFAIDRLRGALIEAKRQGFSVRSEWLGGSAMGWCEYGGRRVLFVDLSLSVHEQLEQVESALASADDTRATRSDPNAPSQSDRTTPREPVVQNVRSKPGFRYLPDEAA